MAFKTPEQFRITKKMAKSFAFMGPAMQELVTDTDLPNNGWFFLPKAKGAKGSAFLCKAQTNVEGEWNMLAINIPTQGRCPTWEECDYLRREFWTENEPVITVHPGKDTYVFNQKFWIYIWEYIGSAKQTLPPVFDAYVPTKKIGFWTKFFRELKKQISWKKK
jgi:hypothetical protein